MERSLRKRGLPENTEKYMNTKDIDPENYTFNPLPDDDTGAEAYKAHKAAEHDTEKNGNRSGIKDILKKHNKKENKSEDNESDR